MIALRPKPAYIGLGSNVGDRRASIDSAVASLRCSPGVRVLRRSDLRETAPEGVAGQPAFLNGALEIETTLEPAVLLDRLLEIERALGRVRRERWGPREIDLDLLLYGDRVVKTERLVVPHPRMAERRFVLEPLAELCPRRVVPGLGRTVRRLLESLGREAAV